MKKILIINASVRNERSHSRKLTQLFVKNWQSKYPEDIFTFREVGLQNIPHINESWIAGSFAKPEQRDMENQNALALSTELIGELKTNDIYIIGTPMYNWSM